MTFIIVLIIVYIVEMIAAYIFFSHAGEKRFKTMYCILIGLTLFASAFFVNILGGNIVWFNAVYFSIMNIALGFICFRISFGKAIMYSVIFQSGTWVNAPSPSTAFNQPNSVNS